MLTSCSKSNDINQSPVRFDKELDNVVFSDQYLLDKYNEAIYYLNNCDFLNSYSCFQNVEEYLKDKVSNDNIAKAYIDNKMGYACLELGKYDEALDYFISVYTVFADFFGSDSPETLAISNNIAKCYYGKGDYESCLKYSTIDNDNSDMIIVKAMALKLRGQVFSDRGQYDEAINILTESFGLFFQASQSVTNYDTKTLNSILGESIDELIIMANIVSMSNNKNTYETACVCFESGLSLLSIIEESCPNAYVDYKAKTLLYFAKLKYKYDVEDADTMLETAQDLLKQPIFNNNPVLLDLYQILGEVYGFVLENEELAKDYYQKALNFSVQKYGENSPKTADTKYNIGKYYVNKTNYAQQGIEHLEEAIEIYKNNLLTKSYRMGEIYLLLSGLYTGTNDKIANEYYSQAQIIFNHLGVVTKSD